MTLGLPVIAEDLEVEVAEPEDFPSFLDFDRDDFERYYRRFDRLEAVCDRLKRSLETPAATVVLGAEDLGSTQIAPHLVSATFNVVDRELYGSFVLGTCDLYTDWPLAAVRHLRRSR